LRAGGLSKRAQLFTSVTVLETGSPMTKAILAVALALAVIGGAVTVSAVATNPAYSDASGSGGGQWTGSFR